MMIHRRKTDRNGVDPSNVQVILSNEIAGLMYFVNDEDIIKHIENMAIHVTDTVVQVMMCSIQCTS